MRGFRRLESIATKYFMIFLMLSIVISTAAFSGLLYFNLVTLDNLAKFTDSLFKIIAVLVGTLWAMNRYFITRADNAQLRVDAQIHLVPATSFGNQAPNSALLTYRLDIINTGKSLLSRHGRMVEIDAVNLKENKIDYVPLYRWPPIDTHPGDAIEPGSWGAIHDDVLVPADTKVVRVYVEIRLSKTETWTWHNTFDLCKDTKQ